MSRPKISEHVQAFLDKMQTDMKQMHDEYNAELALMQAVEHYQQVFKVKLKVTQAGPALPP